ncbi:MAG TPA: hypothetical protein VJ011_10990, partial [Steroidobacteraceae bacterium]|nr:hypothetical protein [Steroidobacteraceae bacterium]
MPKKGGGAADDLTAEGLGWQLRAALPPMRLHSVSLCDVDGDVLWLSEGVLGPDEHGYAQEAIAALSRNASLAGTERDLEDGRAAVFLPVRAPQGAVVGIAMILIDGKSVAKGLAARLVTPQVRTVLMRIATLLKPVTPPVRNEEAVPDAVPTLAPADAQDAEITLAPEETQPLMEALRLEATQPITMPSPEPEPPKGWPRKVQPRPDSTPSLTSEQIDTILTLELTEDTPASEPIARPAARPAPAANGADRSSPALELSLLPDEAPALPGDAPSPKAAAQGKSDAQGKAAPQSKTTAAPTATPSAAATARAANSATAPAPTRARQAAPAPTPATVPPPASAAAPVILRVPTRETAPPVEKQREPSQDLVLSVQQLLKLRSGGRTRRYEVLLRSRHDADRNEMPHTLVQAAAREIGECALDEFVVTQLLGFLGANRGVWETEPASFTVNVSAGAIIDEGFTQVVEALLHRTG